MKMDLKLRNVLCSRFVKVTMYQKERKKLLGAKHQRKNFQTKILFSCIKPGKELKHVGYRPLRNDLDTAALCHYNEQWQFLDGKRHLFFTLKYTLMNILTDLEPDLSVD